MNNDDELINKILDLQIHNEIKYSDLQLELIDAGIKYYQCCMQHLKNNKPFIFYKKRIDEYNIKMNEYEKKISELYNRMEDETNYIIKLYEQSQ